MNADLNKSLTLDRRDPFGALVREDRPRAAAGDGFPQRRASSDISDAFSTLWQRKWLFLAATCALFALFLVLIVRMPSKYAAEAKLLVTDQGAFSVSPTSQTATVANEQTLGTQRQILASRAVLYRVIDGLPEALAQQLAVSPEPSLLDRLLAEANELFGREPSIGIDLPLAAPGVRPSDDLEQQYRTIASNLGSEVVLDTNVISVSYQDRQPEVAVFLVNEIVREYERFSAERRRDNAEASMAWIQEEVDALRERVQAGEQLIADYRMEAAAGTGQSSSDLVGQVGEMGLQIARARQEVARRQASLDAIEAGGEAAISSGLPGSDLYSQVLDNLVDQKLALELQLTGIVDEFGPQHPTYRTVQGGLARVQQGIDAEIARIRTNVETELAQAEAELLSLEAGLSGLSQTRAALETSELTIQDLQRQVSADRNALDQMFLLSSQYSLIGATRGVDVEVLSTAVKANNTPRPNKKLLSVAAFFVAGTLALVLVFAVDFSRKQVSRADHLAMVGVGRYFGQVSSIGCPSVRKLVERVRKRKLTRPLVRAIEQVGQILIRAEDEVQHDGALTIAVTSYAHNEGKSTLAFLMALVAGQINSRALLIDMDLRASSLQAIWPNAEQGGIGVGDFAAEPSARAQLGIVRTGLGFDYIGPGNCVGSPAGLIKSFLGSDAFRMCQDYDVIIIDSAPVGPVADSHHLFGIADCVAFSVMAGQTRIASVAKAMDEIPRVGLHKVRFVMNGVRRKTSSEEHEYLTPITHG
ncbi:MAG: GumC family protein [Alphaproteobacteria bacterium]